MNGSGETIQKPVTEEDHVTFNVSSLSPGFNYSFTVFTVFEEIQSDGFQFSGATGK